MRDVLIIAWLTCSFTVQNGWLIYASVAIRLLLQKIYKHNTVMNNYIRQYFEFKASIRGLKMADFGKKNVIYSRI